MMQFIKILGKSMASFLKDECFYLAASISYFSIMALVPMALLVVTLFGYLLGENQDIYQFTLSGLVSLFPAVTKGITKELENIIIYKGISVMTLLVYGFLSIQLFNSIEHAMNIIFKIPRKRHLFLSIFWSIFVITLMIVFLMLSFTVSSVLNIIIKVFKDDPLKTGYKAGIFLKYITPFVMVLMTFMAIYVIIPRVKIRWMNAFKGALFVTVMWEVAKYFFTWYIKNIIHFGTIYGSLTTFIIFLLWVFYASCIFLFGAELVNNLGRKV